MVVDSYNTIKENVQLLRKDMEEEGATVPPMWPTLVRHPTDPLARELADRVTPNDAGPKGFTEHQLLRDGDEEDEALPPRGEGGGIADEEAAKRHGGHAGHWRGERRGHGEPRRGTPSQGRFLEFVDWHSGFLELQLRNLGLR